MKNTKERILDAGLHLVSQAGLSGVTLGVLAQQVGMSKSGLFAHFGSKEDVQLQLLEETERITGESFVKRALSQQAGLKRLRSLLDGWLGWSEKAGLGGGCPLTAGMFEFDDVDLSHPVRQQLVRMEQKWREFLVQIIEEAVDTGELRSDVDAEQVAWEMCGIYLMHHASQRFSHDPLAFDRATAAFNALLMRYTVSRANQRPSKATRQGNAT